MFINIFTRLCQSPVSIIIKTQATKDTIFYFYFYFIHIQQTLSELIVQNF